MLILYGLTVFLAMFKKKGCILNFWLNAYILLILFVYSDLGRVY